MFLAFRVASFYHPYFSNDTLNLFAACKTFETGMVFLKFRLNSLTFTGQSTRSERMDFE